MATRIHLRSLACFRQLLNVNSVRRCKSPVGNPPRYASSGSGYQGANPVLRYLNSLKWVPIPVGVGFAYLGYQQFGHVKERERRLIQNTEDPEDLVVKDWVVTLYKCLPLKTMSCAWGRLHDMELPEWMREPVYRLYIRCFHCDMNEAAISDLKYYKNLGEFFRRRLKPGARPLDKQASVMSPSDGKILYFGKAERGHVEQVKGIKYSLKEFLGSLDWPHPNNNYSITNGKRRQNSQGTSPSNSPPFKSVDYHANLKMNPDNDLYHCVVYLAPGDYHGFHSPVEWVVSFRRHFPGEIFSVNPGIARLVKGLFNLNERVVYMGEWEHGFFSLAAVGATNVGSIKVYSDRKLNCSSCCRHEPGTTIDETFHLQDLGGLSFKRGDYFGEFNLGSTIVLVFEAPKNFKFNIKEGQQIKYGEAVGFYTDRNITDSCCQQK